MKTLTLLRHAKSTWDDPVARDFDRPLNRRGRKAARAVGKEMKTQGLAFDHVLASPAVRVMETLGEIEAGYGGSLTPYYDETIYLASPDTLLDLVRTTEGTADSLLIVGHNPGIEKLALLLTEGGASDEMRAEIALKYPTATLIRIAFDVEGWSDVSPHTGRITHFIRPRDLDPELGPDEDSF